MWSRDKPSRARVHQAGVRPLPGPGGVRQGPDVVPASPGHVHHQQSSWSHYQYHSLYITLLTSSVFVPHHSWETDRSAQEAGLEVLQGVFEVGGVGGGGVGSSVLHDWHWQTDWSWPGAGLQRTVVSNTPLCDLLVTQHHHLLLQSGEQLLNVNLIPWCTEHWTLNTSIRLTPCS